MWVAPCFCFSIVLLNFSIFSFAAFVDYNMHVVWEVMQTCLSNPIQCDDIKVVLEAKIDLSDFSYNLWLCRARIKKPAYAKFRVWTATRFRNINEQSFVSKGPFAGKTKMAYCAGRGFMCLKKSPNGAVLTDLLINTRVNWKMKLSLTEDETATSTKQNPLSCQAFNMEEALQRLDQAFRSEG